MAMAVSRDRTTTLGSPSNDVSPPDIKLSSFRIYLPKVKSVGHSPDRGRSKSIDNFWGVKNKKSCDCVATYT